MRLYLIRHATVDVPPGTCYGATDVPLIADWRHEAERALALLPERTRREAPIHSSPLGRCAQLAALFERDVVMEPRVREMDFGDWEQQPWAELPRKLIDLWSKDVGNIAPPGGESFAAVSARVLDFLDELLAANADEPDAEAIVVTHGGPLRCFAARALGLPLEQSVRLGLDYAGVASMSFRGELHRIEFWNR